MRPGHGAEPGHHRHLERVGARLYPPATADLRGTGILTGPQVDLAICSAGCIVIIGDPPSADTLLLYPDGRVRRTVTPAGPCVLFPFGTYRRENNLALIDYFQGIVSSVPEFGCGSGSAVDTLALVGSKLERHIADGSVETYQRQ